MARKNETSSTEETKKAVALSAEKQSALDRAMKAVQKKYGANTVMTLNQKAPTGIDSISTGSLSVDIATGIGGFPRGRIIEIYGPESSGKTTLCMSTIREAQKKGLVALFIDMEQAFDMEYARNLGIDINTMLFVQPDDGEMALDIALMYIKEGAADLVVLDSVASLVPRAEVENEMGQQPMGLQARMMGQALRKLTPAVQASKATLIFTNQIRYKIGVVFGNPETTPGGNALKFSATMRIDIRKGKEIKETPDQPSGVETKVTIRKNKVAPPNRVANFEIEYGTGVSRVSEILGLGKDFEVIEMPTLRSYVYKGEKFAGSRNDAKEYLLAHPAMMDEIEQAIRTKFREQGNLSLLDASLPIEEDGEIPEEMMMPDELTIED